MEEGSVNVAEELSLRVTHLVKNLPQIVKITDIISENFRSDASRFAEQLLA
jgi:hypothetical protein